MKKEPPNKPLLSNVTLEDKLKILELFDRGLSSMDVAAATGWSLSTIKRVKRAAAYISTYEGGC